MEGQLMGIKEAWAALRSPSIPYRSKEAPVIAYNNVGTQVTPKDSYYDLAKDGYIQNPIVNRCINEISKGAAAVPFNLMRGDQPIDDHPLLDLLSRPSPECSQSEFFQRLYSYLMLDGNSYIQKAGPENTLEPRELYLLRPDRMRIVPSNRLIPKAYEYVVEGKVVARFDVDMSTGVSDLKQIKLFNPLDDYYGLSPIKSAAADIDQHNLSGRHNVMLLMNGARPSGAVVYKPRDEQGVMTVLTDAQREQLRQDLIHRFEKVENAGRTMILEGDFDYKEMGLTPKDMDFAVMKNFSARDIALCFGVPAQLVGIPDAQTYSNMAEARLALYEETVIPLLRHVESDLNEWLVPQFGEDLTLVYDIDSIPAITERRRMIYENILRAVQEGVLTRNEARERIGLEPISGGDEVYIPANLFPLGEAMPEPVQPASPDEASKMVEEVYGQEKRMELHLTREAAEQRSQQIGCVGSHAHEVNGVTYYMPCQSHEDYHDALGINTEGKAESYKPNAEMAREARQALEWREEFNRGGTQVGARRATQLVNRESLSEDVVVRMFSFFSRHEVDKEAEGFRRGESGYPSAGRIAWGLWGGDAGFAWSRAQRDKILKDKEKVIDGSPVAKTNGKTPPIHSQGISGSQPH
jgi:HK97 family phage portal protein